MDLRQIPIRVIGPGSQSEGEDGQTLSYIDMPSDMSMYRPPTMPEPDAVADLSGAREAMHWLQGALKKSADDCAPQLADLTALDDENRELVNQILGEGEVSINYAGEVRARTQEAVIAGVWRTAYFDAEDRTMIDLLEVADAPHVLRMSGTTQHEINTQLDNVPDEVMNALPILVELQSRCSAYVTSQTPHVINLTLLPLSDADLIFLDEQLGRGPVDTLSRAYGKCQVISTQVPNVWWVRFYNSMGILILNTLEVVDVPAVVRAAPEDLQDSAQRLDELLTFCWSDAT